jgi:hypothetical protein
MTSLTATNQTEIPMLKLISLAIGLITIVSISPKSEAMTANMQPLLQQPAANLHAQIIFRIGDRGYTRREEWQYRRDMRMQRRREAARRQYGRMGGYHRDGGYMRDRDRNRDGQNRRVGEASRNDNR